MPKDVKVIPTTDISDVRQLILWVGGMPWPKMGASHYHAQIGFPDLGLVRNVLVDVCNG